MQTAEVLVLRRSKLPEKNYYRQIATNGLKVTIWSGRIRNVWQWVVCIHIPTGRGTEFFFTRTRFLNYGKLLALKDTVREFREYVKSVNNMNLKE